MEELVRVSENTIYRILKDLLKIELINEHPNDHGDIQFRCPFPEHNDTHQSFSINVNTGLYKCFGCDNHGNLYDLISKLLNIEKEATRVLVEDIECKTINDSIQQEYDANLVVSKTGQEFLKNRGITEQTWETYGLGWNAGRITIPIKNALGKTINIRMHAADKNIRTTEAKVISYGNGYGRNRIFPISTFLNNPDTVYISEGELDAILMNQYGLPTVTGTAGALGWKSQWSGFFDGKNVIIIYDCDDAGRKGAVKTASTITNAKSIKIIDLQLVKEEGKDITDFLMKYTIDNLIEIINKTPILELECDEPESDYVTVNLAEAVDKDFMKENIKFDGQVVGKDLTPYIVPWVVEFNCELDAGEQCSICPMFLNAGSKRVKMDESDILSMVDLNEPKMISACKRKATRVKCNGLKMKIINYVNVEKLFVTPPLDYALDSQYVVRTVYYIGIGIQANATYQFMGKTLVNPNNQKAIIVAGFANPKQGCIDKFVITDKIRENLNKFCLKKNQKIKDKYSEILDDLEIVTGIVDRSDIICLIDLAFHTIIQFDFLGKRVIRGWSDLLILGDTRTGKSEIAMSLIKFYKMGEFVSGENASFAGLLGGMQQFGNEWVISWGKIPLNDRRLVIVDEASGLNHEIIGALSSVRSSGIAEITKIQSESTMSRTRLIWLSNPRDNKSLSSYMYPILAVQSIFERPEDIARLDTVGIAMEEDVDKSRLNERIKQRQTSIDKEDYRDVLMWAWTRKPDQVIFTKNAEEAILKYADSMGKSYSSKIPLVQAADQKFKIAKYSVALAARLFSATPDGETVIVNEEHVEFVVNVMKYAMKKSGYEELSRSLMSDTEFIQKNKKTIIGFMNMHKDFIDFVSRSNIFKPVDIQDLLGFSQQEARSLIKFAISNYLIRRTGNGLIKTKEFVQLLKTDWQTDETTQNI